MYTSVAERVGEIIDSRCLTMAVEFYNLTHNDVLNLFQDVTLVLDQLFGDAVISVSSINGKRVAKEKIHNFAREAFDEKCWFLYGLDAFVTSNIVYNRKTLTAFLKARKTDPFINGSVFSDTAIDYPTYWEQHFHDMDAQDPAVRQKLLNLFQEKGKFCSSHYSLPDLQALYSANPYSQKKGLYYGHFFLDCSAFCFSRYLNELALRLADFVKSVAMQYVNVNGRVHLQPSSLSPKSAHMGYFSGRACLDGSHEEAQCTKKEWYETYYLPGSEWFNVVSPLVRTHLPNLYPGQGEGYTIEMIGAGSLVVQSNTNITGYDVDDARILKKLLYPALYPGCRVFSLRKMLHPGDEKFILKMCPRSAWEIIPIFDEEMKIIGPELAFVHISGL